MRTRFHSDEVLPAVFNAGVLFAALALAACTHPEGVQQPLAGNELFAACATCHGVQGEGNPTIQAPSIAGLPAWYVQAQLMKFRNGARGAHPADLEGLRMRPMSKQMMNEGEVKTVAEYVSTLAFKKPAATLTGGDAAAGSASWGTCLACHGPDGKGNQAMNAPPLAGQSDWYLYAQLKKFKAGVRGANPLDTTGGTMRPMAMTLADEQAMKNVIAHIGTFNR